METWLKEYILRYYSKFIIPEEYAEFKKFEKYQNIKEYLNMCESLTLEDFYANKEDLLKIYELEDIDESEIINFNPDYAEPLRTKIAERIWKVHRDAIFINKCPICGTLARTPLAKQAPCGHRWA